MSQDTESKNKFPDGTYQLLRPHIGKVFGNSRTLARLELTGTDPLTINLRVQQGRGSGRFRVTLASITSNNEAASFESYIWVIDLDPKTKPIKPPSATQFLRDVYSLVIR